MIRHLFTLCFGVGLLLSLSSCQNDGDIGDLYGQWQLTDITTADTLVSPRDLYIAFQSQVFFAYITGTDAHYSGKLKGTWQQQNDSLYLSFYSTEEQIETDTWYIQHHFCFDGNPKDLRFGLRLSSSSMVLTNGKQSQWKFRKY